VSFQLYSIHAAMDEKKEWLITVKQARNRLGEKGKKMTDEEIQNLLNHLYYICNKVIENVIT
jgi:hydroxymethylglutaryl-CoA reductase